MALKKGHRSSWTFYISIIIWALLLAPMVCSAEKAWVSKPITFVVPFPPGGADVMGRILAQALSEELGQKVIVENRPGANGSMGSNFVARAAPDGKTLLMTNLATHAINQLINSNVKYDSVNDFTHIAVFARNSNVLLASPSFKGNTLHDVIAQSRLRPKSLDFAITGYGSSNHMAVELLKRVADIDFNIVPYKGDATAINDMVGRQIDLMFMNYSSALPMVRAGTLRPLAVTATSRSPLLPDVPAMTELGYDVIVDTWLGLAGPANLPKNVTERLNKAVNIVLTRPDVRDRFTSTGMVLIMGTSSDAKEYVQKEIEKWGRVVTTQKIAVE
jgi:tripartite-type tricarboxylate transporter receptor subunit TctC